MAQAVLVSLCLLIGQTVQAQCPISTIPAAPVNVQVVVNQITGMATFSSNDITGIISTSAPCDPVLAYKIRLYEDEAKTLPYPWSPPALCFAGGGSTVTLSCADINTPKIVWAAINDGDAPGGPPCGEFDPTSESSAVRFNLTILDQTAPEAVAPANVTVSADGSCNATAIAGIGMSSVAKVAHPSILAPGFYTDNCLGNLSVSYYLTGATILGSSGAPISGASASAETFNLGVTTVHYIIKDNKFTPGSGANPALVSLTVTVEDTTDPTITCPFGPGFNTNVNTDPEVCTTTIATGLEPASTADNCATPPALTYTLSGATTSAPDVPGNVNGLTFNLGVTTVTYKVADNAIPANTATCAFTVTVTDMQAPNISAAPASGMFNATPVNGVMFNLSTSTAPGAPFCDGTYKWVHPNMADNCSPLNFPPASLTMELSGLTVAAAAPVTPGTNITQTFNGLGATTVLYVATDNNGKTATYTFSTNIIDDVAPVLIPAPAPYATTVTVTPGDCAKVLTFTRPTMPVIEDCLPVTITETYVSGPDPNILSGAPVFSYGSNVTLQFPAGVTVIRYTWSDGTNITTVDYTFTVLEDQPPTAKCITTTASIPLDPLLGVALVPPALINNGSSDNCGIDSMWISPFFFDCAAIDTNNSTVTLTVKDNAGNTSSCTATVFIYDNTLPVLGCPAAFAVSTDSFSCNAKVKDLFFTPSLSSSVGVKEYYDNALDPCGLLFDYQVDGGAFIPYNVLPFTNDTVDLRNVVFSAGLHSVTLRAKDGSNNIGACTFSVNVQDLIAPSFSNTCPGNDTTSVNLGGCITSVSWVPPTFTDNCTVPLTPAIYVTSSHPPGFFFPVGSTTVTYTAHDAAGNINNLCTFKIIVSDTLPPVPNCKNAMVTLGPGGTVIMPAAAIDNSSTDNCFYTYQSGPYSFDCSHVGTPQIVTLTLIDAGGLTASCQATVTVVDTQTPTALCNLIPATLNLSATDPGQVTMNAAAVGNVTDNCPSNVTYQISVDGSIFSNSFTFNCSHVGPRMVTLRATDSAGSSTCGPVTVTIRDVSAPTFTVPPAIMLNCNDADPNLLDPSSTGMPTNIKDNCDGAPTVSYSDLVSTVPGCPNAQNIVRTWTVTDHATPSNSFSQNQSIQIKDVTAPVWSLGTSFSANTTGGGVCKVPSPIPAVVSFNPGANVLDACGSLSVTYGIVFPIGSVPASVSVGTPLPLNGLLPELFPIGVSTVTFVAVDVCNNLATHTVTVTVNDVDPPIFTYSNCGQTYTLPNTTNSCNQLFSWTRPVLADLFDCKTYSVTEAIGNTSVQQFVNLINPFGSWPPANAVVTAQFPVGSTVITYTATDASNNKSTCSFTVVIEDTQAPTIICPMNQTLAITSGCTDSTRIPDYTTLATVTDNCMNNIVRIQSPLALGLVSSVVPVVPGNSFMVTLQAQDGQPLGQLSASCSFTVTLVDGEAPVPDTLMLSDIVSFCGKDTVSAPSATDCNGVNFITIYGTPSVPIMMQLPPLFPGGPPRYVLNSGNYVITWSYTDAQNNTTTQPQNVSISVDNFPPTAICHADSVDLDAAGMATVFATQLDNGSFDQDGCGPVSLSFRIGSSAPYSYVPSLNFACGDIGVNAVVFAATDVNGNTATCATSIKVKDVIAPEIANIPANITVEACDPIPAQEVLTATDVCDADVPVVPTEASTQSATNEVCGFYSYTITRNWTATDDSGNTKTETQTITVIDTKAPVFSSPDSIVVLTDPNRLTCDDTVTLNMLNFLADCAPDSELVVINTLNPALGANVTGVYAVGSHIITFTATDKCGNSATKSIKLVVKDATLPTAVCINGISVALQSGGLVSIGVNQIDDNSFDNCGDPLGLQVQRLDPLGPIGNTVTFNCNDADGVTHHPVRLFVTDLHGNVSNCQTFVVVQDNVAPTITCPPNDTIDCADNSSPAVLGTATAIDNCPILVNAISYGDTIIDGAGVICDILVRTWMARDLAGNVTSCNQLISIYDTIKPVLNAYPPDITISCSEPLPDPVLITATDNCTQNLVVSFQQDTMDIAAGTCGKYDYTVVRTRTATDSCGNTESDVRLIKVQDTSAPAFPAMPDTLKILSANFPANLTCSVPVTLNAAQYFVDCAPLAECSIDTIMFQPALSITPVDLDVSGDYPVGITRVIFTVSDPCGNKGVDTIYVEVIDNSVPTLVCNDNVVVALGSNGDAMIDPMDIDLGSTDNCGIDTLFLSNGIFDCADLGLNSVTLTAVDIYGNSNFCIVEVNVTLGSNAGFTLATTGSQESFFGAGDGTATAVATGGSGTFSYTWSTSDTTTTIAGLAAGVYTITVIDANTGCVSIDTAVVLDGKKITINVGDVSGCQGQSVIIPITVDNFIEVAGFSMGLQLDSILAGIILSISDVNPALTSPILNGNNSIFWTEPMLNGITLPDGTLLFNLNVQLSNVPIPLGTFSPISPASLPTLAFLQILNNIPTPAGMIVFNNGMVTIDCPASDIDLAGDVFTWKAPEKPIPGVDVVLTGTIMDADVTALPLAEYNFLVPGGANTVVTPSKVAVKKSSKINVGDLLFIQAHAAPPPVQIPFTSPYQWMAADINGDNIVNIIDYALVQAYIVNNAPSNGHFNFVPAPPDWKFVPKSYVFPVPNPLIPAPPSTIEHLNITMPFIADDFIGVLMGDVNGDVLPTLVGNNGSDFSGTFKFRINERSVQSGEIVSIPFKALNFNERQAYQFSMAFDADKFELVSYEAGALSELSDANFGTSMLSEGMLSTLWVGGKALTFADDVVLFTLKFKALSNIDAISEVLKVSSIPTEAMAIDYNGNVDDVDFEFVSSVGTNVLDNGVFALYQNQPNPFSSETSISFRLPTAGRAKLHIFGTDGRLVRTIIGDYPAGKNAVSIRKDEMGAPGVYWYELETAQFSDRKKMILIN